MMGNTRRVWEGRRLVLALVHNTRMMGKTGEDKPSPLPYTGCTPKRRRFPILVATIHYRKTTHYRLLTFTILISAKRKSQRQCLMHKGQGFRQIILFGLRPPHQRSLDDRS